MEQKINTSTENMYYSNTRPIPWSDITRFDYSNFDHPKPPNSSLYTVFTLKQYFILFWVIACLHTLFILLVKCFTNYDNFKNQNMIDKIIHALENIQIPAPMKDWDEDSGTIKEHKKRREKVEIEMNATILANFLVHCVMLFPLEILVKKVHERHTILGKSIGALPKEIEAYETIKILSPLCYCFLILGTLTQLVLYLIYNRKFHPFKDILDIKTSSSAVIND